MSVLQDICEKKRAHVAKMRAQNPQALLDEQIAKAEKPRGFIKALQTRTGPALITEIKKASPSQGIIRSDFNPAEIAKIYEANGAACISVLTDEPYFQGRDEYLKIVKSASKLPLLRKDFMIDPYQIYESRALGADCILMIMAALDDRQALDMHQQAAELGMDVLVEIHDDEELDRALELAPAMIGINNRNLKTLDVDIETSFRLGQKIPANIIKVAESGISKSETIRDLQKAGFDAFLIGESLMRQENIASGLSALLSQD